VKCSICGCGEADFIKKWDAWEVVECKNCAFVYITPLPDEQFLHSHYQNYLPIERDRIAQWQTMMVDIFDKSLNIIEEKYQHRRGALLDIGCGYGFFLEEARKRGWRVYGVEPCMHARDYAVSKSLDITSEDLFGCAYEDQMFDVVTLFYVLEHLRDPLRYLKEVNRILKPEGLLLVRLPYTTPIVKLLKALGIPNNLYDVPSHLSDFSPRTIALALEKTGFSKIHTFPGGATHPRRFHERLISTFSGALNDILFAISGGKLLLPGVSITTIASKNINVK
jgi:SAM-dependent methyltransferase